MDYVSVSSSHVAAVGYESETSTLGVRFLDGCPDGLREHLCVRNASGIDPGSPTELVQRGGNPLDEFAVRPGVRDKYVGHRPSDSR